MAIEKMEVIIVKPKISLFVLVLAHLRTIFARRYGIGVAITAADKAKTNKQKKITGVIAAPYTSGKGMTFDKGSKTRIKRTEMIKGIASATQRITQQKRMPTAAIAGLVSSVGTGQTNAKNK
jgi:hypothetical protein